MMMGMGGGMPDMGGFQGGGMGGMPGGMYGGPMFWNAINTLNWPKTYLLVKIIQPFHSSLSEILFGIRA